MHIDPYIVLGSAIVGLLVGMTGAGGGALMTPMLILLFGVAPSAAISSDLVAAFVMRPIGAAVHLRAGTVNLRLVRWMVIGSVPAAFLGAYLLHLLGNAKSAQTRIETALGVALLVGAGAMVLRFFLDRRGGHRRTAHVHEIVPLPAVTVAIGVLGGLIVGMTSVGSDLTQAVPLTLAAALGALGWILCVVLLGAGFTWRLIARPWRAWSAQASDEDGSVRGSGASPGGLGSDHYPADPVEVSGYVD